jgi:hypothetical protein
VQRGNVDSARRNPEGRASGFKTYNSHLWEMPRLLCASEVPSRSGAGPLGRNIEALGFDDAIIVATSSQTPIRRNASPRNDDYSFQLLCAPCRWSSRSSANGTLQTVMTVTAYELLLFVRSGQLDTQFLHRLQGRLQCLHKQSGATQNPTSYCGAKETTIKSIVYWMVLFSCC